jgi:hypothetical protein
VTEHTKVAINVHPHSVPPVQAQTRETAQAPRVSAPSEVAPKAQTAPRKVAKDVPTYGDFHATVTTGDNGRTKLPSGLFDGFTAIVLNLPDGSSIEVEIDGEGRGKLTRKQVAQTGAVAGDMLVFTRVADGVFDVNVEAGKGLHRESVAPKAQTPAPTPARQAPRVNAPSVNSFEQASQKAEKVATPAQLRARAAFAAAAKQRSREAQARKEGNGPNYVKTQPTPAQARVEATRKTGHKQASANQRNFAASLRVTAPVVKL